MIRQDSTNSYTREIRVFISSTFSDMQAERDYLIKKIFPRFARDCRDYNVVFTPLDLRWGITEEESRSGKVVEICLDEIDRTRPYFIGIVGPRYGWVPSQDDTDDYKRLAQKFPWIEQAFAEGKSITEMEMYYGALKDDSQSNAFFCLRRDSSLPQSERETDPSLESRRQELKKKIIKSPFWCTEYSTPKELGQEVYRWLLRELQKFEPYSNWTNRYKNAAECQLSDIQSLRRNYIGGLDGEFIKAIPSGKHIIVLGPEDCGKSAMVANAIPDTDGERIVIRTAVDEVISGQKSLMRLFVEQLSLLHPEIDKPEITEYDELKFRDYVKLYPHSSYTWVIDSPERIPDDADRYLDEILSYPDLIDRFIIITSDSDIAKSLAGRMQNLGEKKDSVEILTMGIAGDDIRREIVEKYLAIFGKKLTENQLISISKSPAVTSLGQLQMFLQMLVNFGVFEDIDKFIGRFMSLESPEAFYSEYLKYLEEEYSKEHIKELMWRLLSSKIGMSEEGLFNGIATDIIERVGMIASLEQFIVRKSGNIALQNPHLAEAAEKAYPITEKDRRRIARLIISDCRRSMRLLKKADWKVNPLGFFLSPLIRGMKIMSDDGRGNTYDCLKIEICRQYMTLNKRRKVKNLCRHFGLHALVNEPGTLIEILSYLSEKNIYVEELLDNLDILVCHYLFNDFSAIQGCAMALRNENERERFLKNIRRRWIPAKIKKRLIEECGLEKHGSLSDLIKYITEEKESSLYAISLSAKSILILSMINDDEIRKIEKDAFAAIKKVKENSFEYGSLKITQMMAFIRLGQLDKVLPLIGEIRSLPQSYYFRVLTEFAETMALKKNLWEYCTWIESTFTNRLDTEFAYIYAKVGGADNQAYWAKHFCERIPAGTHPRGSSLFNVGMAMMMMNRHKAGIEIFKALLSLEMEPLDQTATIGNIAKAYTIINDLREADRWYAKAWEIAHIHNFSSTYYTELNILKLRSNIAFELKDWELAEKIYNQIDEYEISNGKTDASLIALYQLNDLYINELNILNSKGELNGENSQSFILVKNYCKVTEELWQRKPVFHVWIQRCSACFIAGAYAIYPIEIYKQLLSDGARFSEGLNDEEQKKFNQAISTLSEICDSHS